MSYSFGMLFKQVENRYDAINFALDFVKTCDNNAEKMIDLEKYYIPTYSEHIIGKEAYQFNAVDRYWLYEIFNIRFIFWEKYNILGIVGTTYPEECLEKIDANIYFQNSSDQNYEFEEWGTNILLFNELVSKYKEETAENLLKENNNYDLEEIKNDIDYFRKDCLYSAIMKILDLDSWLYKKEGDFELFNFNAINGMDKLMKYSTITRKILYNMSLEDEFIGDDS